MALKAPTGSSHRSHEHMVPDEDAGRQVGQEPPPPAFPLCLTTPPQWELYYPLLPDLLPSLSPGGHRSQGTSEFWETLGAAEASGTVWLSSLNLSPQL